MEFLEELAQGLVNAAKKPNVLNYRPNSETHEAFHKSEKVGRLLRGGNRSGKSVAGVVEGVWRATGRHPYQKTHDVPTNGRIVTVDKDNGIEMIIKPLLKQWTPPSELVNGSWEDSFSSAKKSMTFRNGSVIDIKTHQQDVDAFAGVPRHWIWFDEECPQAIFNECRLRLIDYHGVWWMTMTPVEGQDWIWDRFIVVNNKNVDKFEVDISDNPHLSKAALALLEEDLSEEEKEVRQKGKFVPRGGVILREFNYKEHVIESYREPPASWSIYVSIDHGYNNPTAIYWHAVSKQGEVVTFREHYMRKWIVSKHVDKIKEINREIGREPVFYTGDPSMSQRNAINGLSAFDEYKRLGIPIVPSKKDVNSRNNKMNEYFANGMWHITKDCPNLIREVRGYSFKIFTSPKIADRNNVMEQPNKKNDHGPDSCGYFFNWMPYITPRNTSPHLGKSLTETNKQDFPWEVDASFVFGTGKTEYGFGEV